MAGEEAMFKVILLGEVGVGKTSFFLRLKENVFHEAPKTTIGIDSCSKKVKTDNKEVTLCVWDTAGVERFRTLTTNYYRGSHAAILVYNVSEYQTLSELSYWSREVDHLCKGTGCLKILVGNKIDLHSVLTLEEIKNFALHHDCQHIYHVSSKTGQGVDEACHSIAQVLMNSVINIKKDEVFSDKIIDLPEQPQKGCCS